MTSRSLPLLAAPVVGDAVAVARLDVAVEALGGGVDPPVLEPLVEGRIGVVQPFGRLDVPVEQLLRARRPPGDRVGGGLLVDLRVPPERPLAELRGRLEVLDLQHPLELVLEAASALLLGCHRALILIPSGITGSTVLPKVELTTAAKDAYQAAAAVARPNQPPASIRPFVFARVADAEQREGDRQQDEDERDRAGRPQAGDEHVEGEDAPGDQVEPDCRAHVFGRDVGGEEGHQRPERHPEGAVGGEGDGAEGVAGAELPHPRGELGDAAVGERQSQAPPARPLC